MEEENKRDYRLSLRLNEQDFLAFQALMEKNNQKNVSFFIRSCLFDRPLVVIRYDDSLHQVICKLSQCYTQYRQIGHNYNQIVKRLHTTFGEKTAYRILRQSELLLTDLIRLTEQIHDMSEQLIKKYDSQNQ